MRLIHQIASLFRSIVRSGRVDADLADEMRFHIERETEANIGRGMSPDAARRAARLTFGSVAAAQEMSRDERPGATVREALRDVRFGARLLRKSPIVGITGFAIVALGIGAATAIFSVAYGVLLRPLPFREPDRLVSIWLVRNSARNWPAAADAIDLRRLHDVFGDVALFDNENLNLVGDCRESACEPQHLAGARVGSNFFSVLGVSAALGRTFTPNEDQTGRNHVVVLSDGLWRARFDSDRGIIGRQIRLNDSLYTVVGVMAPDFRYPACDCQAWVPLVLRPAELTRAEVENYRVVARLASGVTLAQARQAASTLAKQLAARGVNVRAGMIVDSMLDDAVREVRPVLTLLLSAVAFFLIIACLNISNLFGARASTRRGEFAVRLALGATRRRLIAQAIAEVVPILLLGGVVGIALARWAVGLFVATASAGMPRVENIELSAPVMAVSVALLVVTGLAASVLPAMQAWRSDFTTMTKDGGRSSTVGRGSSRARRFAVAAQIAFAIPLLVGASLLIRSAINLMHVDAGFRPARITTLKFEVSRSRHPSDREVANYYRQLVDAVRVIPGVEDVALVNRIPLSGGQTNPIQVEHATATPNELTNVDTRTVTPDYFKTMGIDLVQGRAFTEEDDAEAPPVVIVDERLARAFWPGESAIGKQLRDPPWRDPRRWYRVIGVVRHVRTIGLDVDPLPQVYWSYRQWTQNRMVLAARSVGESSVSLPAVMKAIWSVDPEQSVYDVEAMRQIVYQSVASRRLAMWLMAGFSGLALLLAAVGIYGVVAYGVTQRMREFGIRVALGATRPEILRLASWQGASAALTGAAIGLVVASAAAGAMSKLVFGIAPRDAISIMAATIVLLIVALIASYIPARQAAAVDPGITLRAE